MNPHFIARLRWNVITKLTTSLALASLAMVFALTESFGAATPPFPFAPQF
jgi:hypothetical protein